MIPIADCPTQLYLPFDPRHLLLSKALTPHVCPNSPRGWPLGLFDSTWRFSSSKKMGTYTRGVVVPEAFVLCLNLGSGQIQANRRRVGRGGVSWPRRDTSRTAEARSSDRPTAARRTAGARATQPSPRVRRTPAAAPFPAPGAAGPPTPGSSPSDPPLCLPPTLAPPRPETDPPDPGSRIAHPRREPSWIPGGGLNTVCQTASIWPREFTLIPLLASSEFELRDL